MINNLNSMHSHNSFAIFYVVVIRTWHVFRDTIQLNTTIIQEAIKESWVLQGSEINNNCKK